MSGKRYTESFNIEEVGQVLQRGFSVPETSDRPGVTSKSLYDWIKKYGDRDEQHRAISDQQAELRKLRAELRRVSEERDILNEAAVETVTTTLSQKASFPCLSKTESEGGLINQGWKCEQTSSIISRCSTIPKSGMA